MPAVDSKYGKKIERTVTLKADLLVIGGGLAGIVTALEAVRAGKRVCLVDRDTPERFGGLAYWAFGGMALVGTPLQAKMKIADSPERALADWLQFGELDPADHWSLAWARRYVERSRADVHDWLIDEGIRFMPAVNWVERGRAGDGNRVARYHIVWGTARELIRCLGSQLLASNSVTLLHRHRVTELEPHAVPGWGLRGDPHLRQPTAIPVGARTDVGPVDAIGPRHRPPGGADAGTRRLTGARHRAARL